MNERIRLLAEQAEMLANKGDYVDVIEKFAELIVQKCITQIALIGVSNVENEDIMWTVETAIVNIKEHFGVEE